jgi:hypothetical protein
VVERAIMPQELAKADEVFLTGSAAEVTPVGEVIGEIGHYRFAPGTICRLMWEDYDRAVGKQVASAAQPLSLAIDADSPPGLRSGERDRAPAA